jgi:hypothetical protein
MLFLTGVITITLLFKINSDWVKAALNNASPISLPLGIIFYGLAANACYTLGWLTEALWSSGDDSRTKGLRSKVFWLGTAFSIVVTLSPVIFVFLASVLGGLK